MIGQANYRAGLYVLESWSVQIVSDARMAEQTVCVVISHNSVTSNKNVTLDNLMFGILG